MKKRILLLALAVVVGIALVGCGGGGDGEASNGNTGDKKGDVVELKLGHIQSESDLWHQGALLFKEEVEKRSDGTMTVQIYPNSTLGGDRDMAEGLQMGTLDFSLIAGVLGNFEPSIQLLELPYLFDSEEEYKKIVDGEIGQEIADRVLESSGIRIIDFWDRGPRHVTSNKPINSLADIKGLKIRLPEIQAMQVTWEAMGAAPTTMAWNEVYTALQQNVIEAQENPIPFIYGGKINEVQDYLALTAHKYEYVTLSMSEKTWSKLTEEQRQIITDASAAATEFENKAVKEQTEDMLAEMVEGGLTVTEPDTAEFAAAAKPAHEKFAKTIDYDLYQRIIKEIE